jgi:hypothetical protein
VEEEIPPHWAKIPQHLQEAGGGRTTQEAGGEWMTHAGIEELVMTRCLVEEELPPRLSDCCKHSTDPNMADPGIHWVNSGMREKDMTHPRCQCSQVLDSHAPPTVSRLMEEHLDPFSR